MSVFTATSVELLLAVVVASVMGSLHCVGMCGPFALWASGAGSRLSRGDLASRVTLYHLGRLTTYLIGGGLAGMAGAVLSAGGATLGLQSTAARAAGIAMMAWGIARLVRWGKPRLRWGRTRVRWGLTRASVGVSSGATDLAEGVGAVRGGRIAGWLAGLRPAIHSLPPVLRSYVTGALTTLLPCGWLYLFLIVAGGTGGVLSALAVMGAFWLGTLPALTSLVLGAFRFAPAIRPALPLVGSLLLLLTGLYTATGRASADLSLLSDRAAALRTEADATVTLQSLSEEPLPCCSRGD